MTDKGDSIFEGLYSFVDSFREQMKPYDAMLQRIQQNLVVSVQNLAEKLKPINAFRVLAVHQFTYWNPLQVDDIENILGTNDVDRYLEKRIDDITFID